MAAGCTPVIACISISRAPHHRAEPIMPLLNLHTHSTCHYLHTVSIFDATIQHHTPPGVPLKLILLPNQKQLEVLDSKAPVCMCTRHQQLPPLQNQPACFMCCSMHQPQFNTVNRSTHMCGVHTQLLPGLLHSY